MRCIPKNLVANTVADCLLSPDGFPPSAGYSLTLALRGAGVADVASTASVEDDAHIISFPLDLQAGRYYWQLFAVIGGNNYLIESGALSVSANLLHEGAGFDGRTDAEKGLDAVEACLAGKASKDQLSYSIKGRTLTRYSVDELLKLKAYFICLVRKERGIKPKPVRVRL
ncbi:hypothetical protein [Halodesulfovibrio aestuarii]|uniref:Uncharacterized protein n=1 Tax=Halodesulfovibrio aestuarii TaxID=126333 RepID=A0ABV4JTB0_9BACT